MFFTCVLCRVVCCKLRSEISGATLKKICYLTEMEKFAFKYMQNLFLCMFKKSLKVNSSISAELNVCLFPVFSFYFDRNDRL